MIKLDWLNIIRELTSTRMEEAAGSAVHSDGGTILIFDDLRKDEVIDAFVNTFKDVLRKEIEGS